MGGEREGKGREWGQGEGRECGEGGRGRGDNGEGGKQGKREREQTKRQMFSFLEQTLPSWSGG